MRIRRSTDYRDMAHRARRFQTRHFVILYRRGRGPVSRTGITVSRRVGNAVVRNRVKRGVREYVRTHVRDVPGTWDAVVIARPSARDCPAGGIAEQLGELYAYLARRAP
jgi:ribonuclease P protein component